MITSSKLKYIPVGTFGASHGVRGWIKVHSSTDPIDRIVKYKPWYIEKNNLWQPIQLIEAKSQPYGALVRFKEYTDCDQVSALTSLSIWITRDQLPKTQKTQYYWADLEGLAVVTTLGVALGKVDYLFSAGANDVVVVQGDKKHLIPFIQESFIIQIDLEAGLITVDWDPEF